jgi:astacin
MSNDHGDCEFRSTADPQEGKISGRTFSGKPVRYSSINGVAIIEGDIAIGRAQAVAEARLRPMGVVVSDKESLWKNAIVPYQIDAQLPRRERVTEAIAHWESRTKLRFVERTTGNANQHQDYLYFEDQGGCWSSVGRQGGKQTLSLGPECSVGNAIHEIGHAVGLWHEQSREDREKHVTIHYENVIDGFAHNFDQNITDGDDVGAYDYASIMHYPRHAFSKNGRDTITPMDPNARIGQREGLSAGDVQAVASLYP